MSAVRIPILLLAVLSLFVVDRSPLVKDRSSGPPDGAESKANLAKLPIRFEANEGQTAEGVRFVARSGPSTVFLDDKGATFAIRPPTKKKAAAKADAPGGREAAAIRMTVAGGREVAPQPSEQLVTKTNYLRGNDRAKWRTNVPNYAKVTYPSVLDGVDLVFHGENGALEYDFVVAPGANVDAVAMNVEGAADMALDPNGDLRIHTRAGDVVHGRPVVYQRDEHGNKRTIESSYRLLDRSKIGFVVAAYDRTRPLVIDPVIGFATYFGGSNYDQPTGVAADTAGNTYITGGTTSSNLPPGLEPEPFDPEGYAYSCSQQAGYPVSIDAEGCQGVDAFVAKINPTGTNVLWMTYLGGELADAANAIALTVANEPVVVGTTFSYNYAGEIDGFPTTQGAFGTEVHCCSGDAFVTRLSADGTSLVYSTILGGWGRDDATGVAVDLNGWAYVTGNTSSGESFLQPILDRAGVAPDGKIPAEYDQNAFVVKLSPTGSDYDWVHVLEVGDEEGPSIISNAIALDADGRAYITGFTDSANLPVTANAVDSCTDTRDVFVGRLQANGEAFDWLTCLRGNSVDYSFDIALDASNMVYIAGVTGSSDFRTTPGAFQTAPSDEGGNEEGFVTKLNPNTGAIIYSTFLGGHGSDEVFGIAVDQSNTAWVTGASTSSDFPVVNGIPGMAFEAQVDQAFVARLSANGASLLFSTPYGGSDWDMGLGIVARNASLHVVGQTWSMEGVESEGFPVFPPAGVLQNQAAGAGDGFVIRVSEAPLLISPPSVVVQTNGSVQFSAVGGSGGYTFTVSQNNSGATINASTGAYTAGATGGVTDTVTVTDSVGVMASATVTVGGATSQLVLSPTSANTHPKGQRSFTASGGTPPYTWGFVSNASGGTISQSGLYTAGLKGSVTDSIRVTDSAGSTRTATIAVSAGITITPASPQTPPNGTIDFTATGGSGPPYTWSILSGSTSASINPTTGAYSAGPDSNTVDTVQVTDAFGNKATVQVSVGGGLAITPDAPTTVPRGTIEFTAVGGSGAYTWSMSSAPSGGTIDPATGVYTAGAIGNALDIIRCTDSVGNARDVSITVGPALAILPTEATLLAGTQLAFSGAGGSGVYTWSIPTNESGATIDALGLYTAGSNAGTDTVRLSDSLGSTADAVVAVQAVPGAGGAEPGTSSSSGTNGIDGGTFNGISIGGGGTDDCSCRAVGAAPSTTAPRLLAGLALALGLVLRRRRR